MKPGLTRSPRRRRVMAAAYDALTRPLERRVLAGWRARLWATVPAAGRGLEIGYGTGANAPYHPRGADVIATDISPEMLARARGREERADARRTLAAADAQRLPFPGDAFDWVAATLVFCEVPDPAAGLAEVRRVLVPGGRLCMVEHVKPGGVLGSLAVAATHLAAPLVGEHFDRDTEAAVRAAGFEIEQRAWLWRDIVLLLVARNP